MYLKLKYRDNNMKACLGRSKVTSAEGNTWELCEGVKKFVKNGDSSVKPLDFQTGSVKRPHLGLLGKLRSYSTRGRDSKRTDNS